jgi:plastocyanin
MKKSLLSALVLCALAGAIVAGSPHLRAALGGSSTTDIKIDNFSFTPATITVPAGTQVRWTNRDDIPHTVVSDDQVFKSKALDTDDQFTYTFATPGSYKYFCSLHPRMTATVVVQ